MLTCTSNTLSRNLYIAYALREHVYVYTYTYVWISVLPLHLYDISQNLHHLRRNATLLKLTIESVGIYIRKMSHRAKALVELPLKHSYTSTFVIYVLYIVALRHKDDHHKRTQHYLQSEYCVLQSLAWKIGTSLCIQTAHCT